ncbi:MAG: hypothetical protein AAFY15_01645 [Cyanobacteria bacterium J06648_11]
MQYLVFRHKVGFESFDRFSRIHLGQLDRESVIEFDVSTVEEVVKALGDRGQAMQPGDVAIEMPEPDLATHRFWTVGADGELLQLRNVDDTVLLVM